VVWEKDVGLDRGRLDVLSWSLKSFDIMLVSASLWIVGLRCIVTVDSREGIRRSLIAMVNTYILILN
jgi:hypothetical protein